MKNKKYSLSFLFFCFLVVSLFPQSGFAETVNCTQITQASLPRTITTSGIYCLKANLTTSITTGKAITINADNVVIDLNGFELKATNASNTATGIYATGRNRSVVKNGTIKDFHIGISLESNSFPVDEIGNVIDGIHAKMNSNFLDGLRADGIGSIIRNCQVVGPATFPVNSNGIMPRGDGATAINNDIQNAATGIYGTDGDGIVIENNRVGSETLAVNGIILQGANNSSVINNRIFNAATGIYFQGSTGKYRDNVTTNCSTPFSGGTDIGNNN